MSVPPLTAPLKGAGAVHPLAADLDAVVERTRADWETALDGRLLITGGTGFVGTWLLETLLWARRRLGVRAEAFVVCRHPERFAARAPRIAEDPAVSLVRGDVCVLSPPPGAFDCVIHAAAEASTQQAVDRPEELADTIVAGTARVLEIAAAASVSRFLYLSSGAVYGHTAPGQDAMTEEQYAQATAGGEHMTYMRAKRAAETQCAAASGAGMEVVVARGFSFVGPCLPLDAHFAIGNFIRDGLQGGPIVVRGDGRAVRSYLYAADMAAWLWALLARGRGGRAYNVGSERGVSVAVLAATTAACFAGGRQVVIEGRTSAPTHYVPSTRRAREELGLEETVTLEDAIGRTIAWHQAGGVA